MKTQSFFYWWENNKSNPLAPNLANWAKLTENSPHGGPSWTSKIKEKVKLFGLDAVQLHGDESPRQCAALLNLCEVIKAFRIGPDFDFKTLTPYQDHCTYFLFDTQGPLPGGNGTAFDWKLLAGYTLDTPFFLSGGIGLGHVEAIAEIRKRNLPIDALDNNSQFESKPGVKKIEKIEKFKQLVQL